MNQPQAAAPFTSREFRNALGRFASGITVVTTVIDGETYGMTANAFVSVSLEPPLVLVSVANKAHMHGYLQQSGRYGVSVLTSTQEEYSQHFAGFGPEAFKPDFVEVDGIPLLAESLAHMIVTVTDARPAGDHTLYIGQVEYVQWWDSKPLLYFQGRYERLT